MSARRVSETGGVAGRRCGRPTVLLAVCASLVLACQANGLYEPVHCDESLALERAGTWRSEIDVLQVAQADDDVAELCDHGSFFGDCPSSGADWVIELPPGAQEPGVHKNHTSANRARLDLSVAKQCGSAGGVSRGQAA
jgi:hypothetical protein